MHIHLILYLRMTFQFKSISKILRIGGETYDFKRTSNFCSWYYANYYY